MSFLRLLPLAGLLAVAGAMADADAEPVKIALIGDSITQGAGYAVNGSTYAQNGNRSWRWEFFKHLVDAGTEFDFVGSLTTNYTNNDAGSDDATNAYYPAWRGVPFDRDHDGHWGWRASQVLGATAGPSSGKRGTGNLGTWLSSYTPDSVVMMIGINDLNDPGKMPETLAADVSALVDQLQADHPAVRIRLCELLHVGPSHANRVTLNTAVDLYNSSHLPAIAAAKSTVTSIVSVVPMVNPAWNGSDWTTQPGGWDPGAMTYDNVHPNSRGEAHIAGRVANAFGLESQWTPVAINNGNFEGGFLNANTAACRPNGWSIFGTPNAAAVPKGLTDYSIVSESAADTGASPGSSYIIAGPADTGVAQTLVETVQAGREYQLQVSLYKASSAAVAGDYAAELRANGVTLATIPLTEGLPMFVTGTGTQLGKCLKEFTASFRASDVPSAVGSALEIRLMARNNARYIGFEDVRLSWKGETVVPEDETLKIFVLTGQSNSLGTLGTTDTAMRHGALGTHPAEQAGGVPFYWDNRTDGTVSGDAALGKSSGWAVVGAQTGGVYAGNDDHWGPEVGFARMLWNAGYRNFAIVKASRGGGGNSFWQKGSVDDHMYEHVIATVNAALADLPGGYEASRIAGLLYVQGESNTTTESNEAGTRFSELLANLKTDLPGASSITGVFGEIAGTGANRDTTRSAQLALANSRADVGYAESTGLAVHNQDGLSVHYDAESEILLGERMAAEVIGLDALPVKPLPAWASLHAWFMADNGMTFDSADAVNRWADLHNGNAVRDLSRRVSGQTFRRAVTAGNGQARQVMRFDGTNDLWSNATTEFGALTGARSVAVLCRVTDEADGFLFDGTTGTGRTRAQVRGGQWQAGVTTSTGSWNGAEITTTARQTGAWQQHVFSFLPNGSGGTTVAHWVDGALTATVTDSQVTNLGGLILGSNGGSPFLKLKADIAEVAVFASVLGASEVAELKSAWDARWGTPSGPPFSATVMQTPREIARFGRHELLEIAIDTPAATTLQEVRVQLAPGTRERVTSVELIDAGTGAVLGTIDSPGSDALVFPVSAALLEGSHHFHVAIIPQRHAALGSVLDAAVTGLTISNVGEIVPANADPGGALTLGLVPQFTDVVKSGDLGINTFRIPGIVADGAGVLHAVYDHRYDNSADLPANVDVGYSRSTDGGATWSTSRVIVDYDASEPGSSGNGVGDPCILYDPVTDTMWVAALWSFGNRGYNGSGAGTLPTETGQYVLTKSEDGGDTWSAPINVTAAVKDNPNWRLIFQGPGHGVAMRDGTLVFPSQYRDESGTVRVCSVFSADHGATWDFGSGVPTSSPQTNENTACELDDGRLLFSMRTPSGSNGQRAWIRYTPGGATPMRDGTWGSLFRLPAVPDPVCQGSVIQWTSRHRGDPRELVLFGNPASTSSRSNFTLRVSPDGGDTWPVSRQLYAGSAAYSSICILPDRSIGVLFEKDDYSRITFARVEESWLLNPSADADSDGMPDAWELLNGLNASANDAGLDRDHDGVSNRDEYVAGTDPENAASVLGVTSYDAGGNLKWKSVPGRSYAVEESEELSLWETVPGLSAVLATGDETAVVLPEEEGPVRFYRVRVMD
ncbi:exo-alpha-sialidase [Luteolibacter arcticus]|uniref:exo-alpha-sialidase n=1 Tax=Luteolibacter arcticus TaxID=1581411 RepID=A0ABT3GQH4_9BACT|nr:sialate O-acetylesterase [Luteolibacter arcticus]MCW1925774.1 exo-alpha-sialidase [Luteolibacter arcticus]